MKPIKQLVPSGKTRACGIDTALALSGLLLLSACSSAPLAPDREIQAAELTITNAEQARVSEYASQELGEARKKLAAAKSAVQEEKMDEAKRFAEQSRVDAELAIAKSGVGKATVVNDEMKSGTETIKQEMNRSNWSNQ